MTSESGAGCSPVGSSPSMTTLPPRVAPRMADSSPKRLPEHSTTTSASTAAMLSESLAFDRLVRAERPRDCQRILVHVDRGDLARPARAQDRDHEGTDRSAADDEGALAATSPARATACHATAAGSATAAVRSGRSGGSGRSMRDGQNRVLRECALRCGGIALHCRGTCSPVRDWGDRRGTAA